jgi:hypothetical protein
MIDILKTCRDISSKDNLLKVIYHYKQKSILETQQNALDCLEEYQNSRMDPNSEICKIERLERISKSFIPKQTK